MIVRTARQADQDIIALYVRGVADFGVDQAERCHQGLIALFDLLAENPLIARERTEFHPTVRLYAYQAHMIAYVEHHPGILIVRVLHGRQDWERYLR
jgi:toxin ParE1/3/4